MIERVLVLIKPDGVERALIGKIVAAYEESGLKVIAMKMLIPTEKQASDHYIADEKWLKEVGEKSKKSYMEKGIEVKESEIEIGMRIRNNLIRYLTSGPIVAFVLEGNNAISVARKIAGSTDSSKADPSTIRGRYSNDSYDLADSQGRALRNLVHVSDSRETAEREISVWFSKEELISYKRADEIAQYGR
ncbi:MAG: nucleoside diphosphate kinase [Candidatus Micrarchaeota archaeon]|nr:MAG: nucleoside diphosphate kinase [Candidatus Micrarchaeota archaeon]